jgi:hypothetical protein
MDNPKVTQGIVPRIAVLVVDVHVRALFDSSFTDRPSPYPVPVSPVDLVLLRTVVLTVLLFVVSLSHASSP